MQGGDDLYLDLIEATRHLRSAVNRLNWPEVDCTVPDPQILQQLVRNEKCMRLKDRIQAMITELRSITLE